MSPSPDNSYKYIWKSYTAFVDIARQEGKIEQSDKYLSPENVDYFYKNFVSKSKNCPSTVKRIRAALQYYIDRVEFLSEPHKRFKVSSSTIDESLLEQQGKYIEDSLLSNVDPHQKVPTNTLSHDDHVLAMTTLLKNNYDSWMSIALSWTLGSACLIRPATFLKLKLSNIYLDERHAPPSGTKFTVSYLLPPHALKGGQNNGKGIVRVVGSWRHVEYKRCAVGYLAMILFVSLYYDTELDFYRGRGNGRPKWWDVKILNEWQDTTILCRAYKRFLTFCGIRHNKCSYIRSSGIDEAGFEGELFNDQIGTMSKHTTQNTKLDIHYMPELYPPVLRTLAGFYAGTTYSVPRTEIIVDWCTSDKLVKYVFPKQNIWKSQIESRLGDKSQAANNFVYKLLPALALVVVQDGIYWCEDFPNHFVTKTLLKCMPPNYERWAKTQRDKVDKIIYDRSANRNANIDTYSHSVNSFHSDFRDTKKMTTEKLDKIQATCDAIIGELIGATVTTSAALTATVVEPVRNINTCELRNTPVAPVLPQSMPKTIVQLLQQHLVLDISNVKVMHGLPIKCRMAICRRQYLFKETELRASGNHKANIDLRSKLLEAAETMDNERKSKCMTVTQYLNYLKKNDSNIKKRKRVNDNLVG